MKKKTTTRKLKINDLKVESFITKLDKHEPLTIAGGGETVGGVIRIAKLPIGPYTGPDICTVPPGCK